jgi:YVTN family beta-propeller protein
VGGIFITGIIVGYVVFSATLDPTSAMFQNRQMFDQMMDHPEMMKSMMQDSRMKDPIMTFMKQNPEMIKEWMSQDSKFRDQMIGFITQDPEQMRQWMESSHHVQQMTQIMKENHDFMMEMMLIMVEDPSLRLQMIGHLTENPEALKQLKQVLGVSVKQDKEEQKMEIMNKMLDDAKSVTVPDSLLRSYDISVAYFAMGPVNLIKVVNTTTHEIVDILPANNNPHGIAVTPDGRYIFTTSTKMGSNEMLMEPAHGVPANAEIDMKMMMSLGSNEIVVTDRIERNIIKKIDVGGGTHHMDITPEGKRVLATVPSKSGISIIDTTTMEESNFIQTGLITNYVVITSDGKYAYVSNKGEDTVSVIDLESEIELTKIPVGIRPDHLAISPNNKFVYLVNGGSDDAMIINTELNQVVNTISVGEAPHGITVTPDGQKIYLSNSESKTITVIDAQEEKIIKNIDVGLEVEHVEVVPTGNFVYVNSENDGIVTIIDTNSDSIVSTIIIGQQPHQIAFVK